MRPMLPFLAVLTVLAALSTSCQSTVKASSLKDTTVGNGHADFPNKVIVGTVTDVTALSTTGQAVSEHAPAWQDATVTVERIVQSLVDSKTIHVRFQGSNDVAWLGWPKLQAGQRAELVLHHDTVTGLSPEAFLISSGDDVRAVDDSTQNSATLMAQLAAGGGAGPSLAATVQAMADQGLSLEGGIRTQVLGTQPAVSVPTAASLIGRLTYSGGGLSNQLYLEFQAAAGGAVQLQSMVRTGALQLVEVNAEIAALLDTLQRDPGLGADLTTAANTLATRGFQAVSGLQATLVPATEAAPAAGLSYLLDLRQRGQDLTEEHLFIIYAVQADGSKALRRVWRTGETY